MIRVDGMVVLPGLIKVRGLNKTTAAAAKNQVLQGLKPKT